MKFRIKDPTLAKEGRNRIDWAEAHMPVLVALSQKYEKTKPLKGKLGASMLQRKPASLLELSGLQALSYHGAAAIH
jgi:S-adenosylhomocysteine hydrolase